MKDDKQIDWFDLGKVSDIPKRGSRRVTLAGTRIGVFRTQADEVFALEDKCPHLGGPLSEGIVHGNCVTCPLHNWIIDLQGGTAQGADSGSVKSYPVNVSNKRIYLGVEKNLSIVN